MKKVAALVCALLAVFAVSCSKAYEDPVNYAMGAAVTQKLWGADEDCAARALEAIITLEEDISYRKSGDVSKLNGGETAGKGQAYEMIRQSAELWRDTGGAYDITVLPLVRAWGFDTETPRLPSEEEIALALALTGNENVVLTEEGVYLKNGAQIDLSAAGKGAACEAAIEVYKSCGATGGIVAVGGSVGVFGSKENGQNFRIAVRDPFDRSSATAALTLTDTYISTSGSYEKCFTRAGVTYHHLLDVKTGYPVRNGLVSVTVVCGSGALSDMLSSACFCMGMEESLPVLQKYSAEALFIKENGEIFVTSGLVPYVECEKYEVLP